MSLICHVCFWEDDALVGDRLDEPSVCNHMTLRYGRANFAAFGACDRELLKHVVPTAERSRYDWRPLPPGSPSPKQALHLTGGARRLAQVHSFPPRQVSWRRSAREAEGAPNGVLVVAEVPTASIP